MRTSNDIEINKSIDKANSHKYKKLSHMSHSILF